MKRCLACSGTFDAPAWRCPRCGFAPEVTKNLVTFAPEADAHESYNPAWYEELARLEEGNFWFRARNRMIAWLCRRHLPAKASFLEIGCGTGYVLHMLRREFPEWRMTASEVFLDAFRFASQRVDASVRMQQFDGRSIPYREEFDVIGAFDVIEHVADDAAILREIHAALKPDGLLVGSVPQHRFLWSRYDELGHHFRRYEPNELDAQLASCGFRMVETTSFNTLLLPLMWLSRRARRISDDADLLDELRIGRATNGLLAGVLAIEFALVRLGIRWPAGGSRIFVAAKRAAAEPHASH